MQNVEIWSEYITLGQLLKLLGYISYGSDAKAYLADYSPEINGEPDNRRGRKVRPDDIVKMPDGESFKIIAKA